MRKSLSVALWLAPALVILVISLWLAWNNMGRMIDINAVRPEVKDTISKYASDGTGKTFACELTPQDGYPKQQIETPSDLFTGNHQVMGYDWVCKSGDEAVTGIFAIFADDEWVWQGESSSRGDLSTHEM